MNTKTNTKTKTKKFDLDIDLTDAETAFDVYKIFGEAKINKYLTDTEINNVTSTSLLKCVCTISGTIVPEKKPNIFKRFWNWITRKK